jgi:hypothetical protein
MVLNRALDFVEYWHNWASDTNFVWLPFLNLKLKPFEALSFGRLCIMAVCFGSYFNVVYGLKKILFSDGVTARDLASSQVFFMFGFFVWFVLVTRPLWNRRAHRLMSSGGSRE